MPRGMQVWRDVDRRKATSGLVLDDAFGWRTACRNRLLETKGNLSLSDPATQDELKKMLAAL